MRKIINVSIGFTCVTYSCSYGLEVGKERGGGPALLLTRQSALLFFTLRGKLREEGSFFLLLFAFVLRSTFACLSHILFHCRGHEEVEV